jgi:dihydrofolate reductase
MNCILAADEKWGIGKNGKLLCHLPGDLRYFKKMTSGKTVIMGRVTLESFPGSKPLPNRRNIVFSRNSSYSPEGVETVHSLDELMPLISKTYEDDIFVIGGEKIYNMMLPYCRKCYVTKIKADFGADRFFPNLDNDTSYKRTELSGEHEENGIGYQMFLYEKI